MPRVKSIRHTGIVVDDLEISLSFYRDFLGLEIFSKDVEIGDFIDNVVNLKNVKLEWIKLKSPNGNHLVELLKYHTHPQKAPDNNHISNDIGCSHIAFTVNNIEQCYSDLIELNMKPNNPPQVSPNGKAKVLYCNDPEGVLVELVEEL